jgi:hypothetical protein
MAVVAWCKCERFVCADQNLSHKGTLAWHLAMRRWGKHIMVLNYGTWGLDVAEHFELNAD